MATANFTAIIMSALDESLVCVFNFKHAGLRQFRAKRARPPFYDFDIERSCSRDFLKLDSPLDKSALHFPRRRIFISRPRTIIQLNSSLNRFE